MSGRSSGGRSNSRGRGGRGAGRFSSRGQRDPSSHRSGASEPEGHSLSSKTKSNLKDSDGVLKLVQGKDREYRMHEFCKSLEHWIGTNNPYLNSLTSTGKYNRYIKEVEADKKKYKEDSFYRDRIQGEMKERLFMKRIVGESEIKVYSKLWSLLDENMQNMLMGDDSYEQIQKLKRPDKLWELIMKKVNLGSGRRPAASMKSLRHEHAVWAMTSRGQSLGDYFENYKELLSRSGENGITYDAVEQIETLVCGLSSKFDDFKLLYDLYNDDDRPKTLTEAYKKIYAWDVSSKHYTHGYDRMPSSNLSAFAVTDQSKKRFRSNDDNSDYSSKKKSKSEWKKSKSEKKDDAKSKDESKSEKKTSHEWTEDGEAICSNCSGIGHFFSKCPSKIRRVSTVMVSAMKRSKDESNWFLLDNGAEVSIFNSDRFLNNVESIKAQYINGVSGDKPVEVTEQGSIHGIPVLLTNSVCLNLFSFCALEKVSNIYVLNGWGSRAIAFDKSWIWDFTLRGGSTQYLDMNEPIQMNADEFNQRYREQCMDGMNRLSEESNSENYDIGVTRVEDRMQGFSKKELTRARIAWDFKRNCGFRSNSNIWQSVKQMTNTSITWQDLENAVWIWGTPAAEVKGKSKKRKARAAEHNIPSKTLRRNTQAFADPIEIQQCNGILMILKPSSLMLYQPLISLKAKDIYDALNQMFHTISVLRMEVTELIVDPDRALQKAAFFMHGNKVTVVGEHEHVVDVERGVQDIKNTFRAICNDIPWPLPPSLVQALIMYTVRRRNVMVTSATNEAPLATVSGVPINAEYEFGFSFGDRIEVRSRINQTNSMNPRSEAAIVLYPIGRNGRWKILYLKTWMQGATHPRKKDLIPTSDEFITFMTNRFEKEKPNQAYRNGLMVDKRLNIGEFGNYDRVEGPVMTEQISDPYVESSNDPEGVQPSNFEQTLTEPNSIDDSIFGDSTRRNRKISWRRSRGWNLGN